MRFKVKTFSGDDPYLPGAVTLAEYVQRYLNSPSIQSYRLVSVTPMDGDRVIVVMEDLSA